MTYSEDQLWDLLNQVYRMPYGSAQIALVEQVIAHADAQHLAELAFAARMQATTSYGYGGEPARSFVTFSWCLAEFDQNPSRYAGHQRTLLWHFKHMVNALTKFPEVPLERTWAVLDDMEGRWRATGHTMQAVHAYRHRVFRHIGDHVAAADEYARWCATPRDDLSDCMGCDPSAKGSWLASRGLDEEAVALGEPVLAGQLTCSEQPQGILTTLLKPYLRTGRLDRARDAHRRAYRSHRPNLADLGDIADHVEFCALTGNEARGVEILERHLGWLDRAPSPHSAMIFAAAGALVLRRAAEQGHPVRLHRPAHDERPAADVEGAALEAELTELALGLAARFDARNGTDFQGRSTREVLDAPPLIEYLPLSPTAPRPPGPGRGIRTEPRETTPGRAVTEESSDGGASDEGRRRTQGPGVRASGASASLAVPDGAGPDELLDLVDELGRDHRSRDAYAVLHAFDERFAGQDLTLRQRARRADGHAVEVAQRGELAEAEAVWRTAEQLFAQAGDQGGRDRVLARLGVVLCETGRVEEGLELLRSATDRLISDGPSDRRYSAAMRLADCYARLDRHVEALAELERAGSLADGLSADHEPRAAAELAVERLWILRALGRFEEVRAGVDEAVRLCRRSGLAPLVVRAHVLLGSCHEVAGDAVAAAEALATALDASDDDAVRGWLRLTRANLLAGTHLAGEVLDDLVEAVAERTAAGDALGAAQARHPLAQAYLRLDRLLDAAEVAEEELAALQRLEGTDPIPARYLLATIYQRLDQPDQAIVLLEWIRTACAEVGNLPGLAQMAEELADLLDRLDRDADAAARYLEAARAYQEIDSPVDELRCRRRHAMLALWAHGTAQALPALATADELAGGISADHGAQLAWERAMLHYDAARILRAEGRAAGAIDRARRSAEGFRSIDARPQVAGAEVLHADLLLADGRASEAESAARRALAALPRESDPSRVAMVLTAALTAQGRTDEAAACRAEYGLPEEVVDGDEVPDGEAGRDDESPNGDSGRATT